MLDPIINEKEKFLEKFHNWYLKDLPLDIATSAIDFLIDHLGKANKLTWYPSYGYRESDRTTYPTLVIQFTYLLSVDGTIVETVYSKEIDTSKQS